MKRSWLDLEKQLGGLTADKLLSLSFLASLKHYAPGLTNALDSRLAINPEVKITSIDVLNLASWYHQTFSLDLSSSLLMGISLTWGSSSGHGGRVRGGFLSRGSRGHSNQQSTGQKELEADLWGKKYLLRFLAMCAGNGITGPQRTKNSQPPLPEPRTGNSAWHRKTSLVMSGCLVVNDGNLASVLASPEHKGDVLCGSGETNDVTS